VVLARVGGEEFAVLMEGLELEAARTLAERIRAAVDGHAFCFGKLSIPVTISLGVAELAEGSPEGGQDLFKRADEQLYKAKQGGRNRVCC
jgi:diguanylate cyclase (GGDEF)-like protein